MQFVLDCSHHVKVKLCYRIFKKQPHNVDIKHFLKYNVIITLLSGFCHFGLEIPDTPVMSLFSCEHAASSVLKSVCLVSLFHVGAWCSDPDTHVLFRLSFSSMSGFGH